MPEERNVLRGAPNRLRRPLAEHGRLAPSTIEALERLKASGRALILVTGRELGDLEAVFPQRDRFDAVVAENGALL